MRTEYMRFIHSYLMPASVLLFVLLLSGCETLRNNDEEAFKQLAENQKKLEKMLKGDSEKGKDKKQDGITVLNRNDKRAVVELNPGKKKDGSDAFITGGSSDKHASLNSGTLGAND